MNSKLHQSIKVKAAKYKKKHSRAGLSGQGADNPVTRIFRPGGG
jgi:hypothetical protein